MYPSFNTGLEQLNCPVILTIESEKVKIVNYNDITEDLTRQKVQECIFQILKIKIKYCLKFLDVLG